MFAVRLTCARELPVDALAPLIAHLLAQLPENSSPVVLAVRPEMPTSSSVNGQRRVTRGVVYEPAVVYVLELATVLALRDEETVAAVGPAVAKSLQSIIRDAVNTHPTALSRVIYYLLRLLKSSNVGALSHSGDGDGSDELTNACPQEHSFLRPPVVLHALSSLEPGLQQQCAPLMLAGIARCISEAGPLRNEMINSPDFWTILRALHAMESVAPTVFSIIEGLTADRFSAVTADNYEAAVLLLNDFASAGSVGAQSEQRQDALSRRAKTAKQLQPQ